MTKYIKKNQDGTFDKTIINFFLKEKSIAKTVFKMNHDHGVIISRAEIINLLKNTDNGHLIKTRTNKKKNDQ